MYYGWQCFYDLTWPQINKQNKVNQNADSYILYSNNVHLNITISCVLFIYTSSWILQRYLYNKLQTTKNSYALIVVIISLCQSTLHFKHWWLIGFYQWVKYMEYINKVRTLKFSVLCLYTHSLTFLYRPLWM